jgi:hypothetical protein
VKSNLKKRFSQVDQFFSLFSFLVFRVHHHHHLMLPICCCLIITSVVANLLSCGESSELFFAISCKISFLKARPHQFQSNDQEQKIDDSHKDNED